MAIAISVFALVVSIYSVWDRFRDTRRQLRMRFSEVVDELNKVTFEQDKWEADREADGKPPVPRLRGIANSRREVLCAEAEWLDEVLAHPVKRVVWRKEATSSQLRAIAGNWARINGRAEAALPLFDRVIEEPGNDSIEELFALRGRASVRFRLKDPEGGRSDYERAAELASKTSSYAPSADWTATETYLGWARSENDIPDGKPLPPLKEAKDRANDMWTLPYRDELLGRIEKFA